MDQYDDVYDGLLEATDNMDEVYEALSDRQRIALELALAALKLKPTCIYGSKRRKGLQSKAIL